MKRNVFAADRIFFGIEGQNPQRFINLAVQNGIYLSHLQWEKHGFSAQCSGRDIQRLRHLAGMGKWNFFLKGRRGPGALTERLLGRPGLPAGAILFLVMIQLFSHLVWTIDFGCLDSDAQERMRTLLAECDIVEGTFLHSDDLARAQEIALQQSDLFGWISLNFSNGALTVEHTQTQQQSIQAEPPLLPLYAKTGGTVLAVESLSGFALVSPGQTVEAGQLLVDSKRLDRDGREIEQGASGRILAACEKTYTASQDLLTDKTLLSGDCSVQKTLYIAGFRYTFGDTSFPESSEICTEWSPLHLGRLKLPGSFCEQTFWQQSSFRIQYSPEQALALAQRNCRAQLLEEFPDAQIDEVHYETQTLENGIQCAATYRFRADIAVAQAPAEWS